jgi:hypothetical protein
MIREKHYSPGPPSSDVMNTCFATTKTKREDLAHARSLSTAIKIEYLVLENLNTIINRINY